MNDWIMIIFFFLPLGIAMWGCVIGGGLVLWRLYKDMNR